MPSGISAQGTIIASSIDPNWLGSGSVSFTNIAELKDITLPERTRNELDITTHNESDEAVVVGIRRSSAMTFMINFVPDLASHDSLTGLQKQFDDGARRIWRVTYPSADQWLFSGFITAMSAEAPVDDVLTGEVSVKPSGRHMWIIA